jgi:hypothetical protein
MPEELVLLDPINVQSFIEFLEYEEGYTKDPETAKRIRELLIKLNIWNLNS